MRPSRFLILFFFIIVITLAWLSIPKLDNEKKKNENKIEQSIQQKKLDKMMEKMMDVGDGKVNGIKTPLEKLSTDSDNLLEKVFKEHSCGNYYIQSVKLLNEITMIFYKRSGILGKIKKILLFCFCICFCSFFFFFFVFIIFDIYKHHQQNKQTKQQQQQQQQHQHQHQHQHQYQYQEINLNKFFLLYALFDLIFIFFFFIV